MGSLGGLLGTAGGVNGTGIQGPSSAPITNPVTGEMLGNANTGVQNSMQSQQQLLAALQQQGGLGNQSQVYNQLQGVAAGTGPNPAQAMLNQQTGANIASQASLMAGQRGSGANSGMMARQIANQGANTQQQAVGQGATMQANQSLNALGQAGQMANTMAGQQIGQTNANTQANQAYQGNLLGAQGNFNNAVQSGQSSINAANAGLANTNMQGQQGMIGGALNTIGGKFNMAEGGAVGPQSALGQFLTTVQAGPGPVDVEPQFTPKKHKEAAAPGAPKMPVGSGGGAMAGGADASGLAGAGMMVAAQGGRVPAMVSPGEVYLPPDKVKQVAQGANPMKVGEKIGGKPAVGGAKNSYANDTVKKDLQAGGIVVPRSETKSKNPDKASADFVAKILAKRGRK